MPRTLANPGVIAALVALALLGAVRLVAPFLASRFQFLAEPRPPDATVVASSAFNVSVSNDSLAYLDSPVAVQHSWTTLVDINYRTPIDVNNTADIEASVRQEYSEQKFKSAVGEKDYDLIKRLVWPITLRLDGPGLEWTEHDIPIKEGTPLPVTEHWVPRAKAAGEYVMRLSLRDINHAAAEREHAAAEREGFAFSDTVKVTVNGVTKEAHGSDDVTLPISVWTHGIPARWFDRLTFFGTAISGLAALVLGVFGSGWGIALLKAMRRRTSHP